MKKEVMQTALAACPECHGDLFLNYKGGSRWKCIQCSRYFESGKLPLGTQIVPFGIRRTKTLVCPRIILIHF